MKLWRPLMMFVMALVILPWGGVAAAVMVPRAVQTQVTTAVPEVKASAPRKCRGRYLPGWPCGQESWQQATVGTAGPGSVPGSVWVMVNWVGRGQAPTPPHGPPRAV